MRRVDLKKDGRVLRNVALADNYFLRLRGLIGRDVRQLGGLLIRPCHQIHTFHMAYPIDVVYLSREGTVVKVDPCVPVNRMYSSVRGAYMTLELPPGDAGSLGIEPGDQLIK